MATFSQTVNSWVYSGYNEVLSGMTSGQHPQLVKVDQPQSWSVCFTHVLEFFSRPYNIPKDFGLVGSPDLGQPARAEGTSSPDLQLRQKVSAPSSVSGHVRLKRESSLLLWNDFSSLSFKARLHQHSEKLSERVKITMPSNFRLLPERFHSTAAGIFHATSQRHSDILYLT